MIIIDRAPTGTECLQTVVLFGTGLIGSAIIHELRVQGVQSEWRHPFDWTDQANRKSQSHSLIQMLSTRPVAQRGLLSIIWAAGKAGFGAGDADFEREMLAFQDVLEICRDLVGSATYQHFEFHLMSSAGGLFEGRRFVDQNAQPSPLRSYGASKLAQESALSSLPPALSKSVYRPSSVYGFTVTGGRTSLINALLIAGLTGGQAKIFGLSETVRDYVLAADVGRFVVDSLGKTGGVHLLASGKPSSVFEIISIVERVVKRRLLLRFETNPSNSKHMSFQASALNERWQPTDLVTGIKQTALLLSGNFYSRPVARASWHNGS